MPQYVMTDGKNSVELWAPNSVAAEDEYYGLIGDYPLTLTEDGVEID